MTINEMQPKNGTQSEKLVLQCGAGPIRAALKRMARNEREKFLHDVWPDLNPKLVALIAQYPDETRVNGAQLTLPPSWSTITEPTPLLSSEDSEEYWRRVNIVLKEVFQVDERLGVEYRSEVERLPIDEMALVYHATPLQVGADLASVLAVSDEQYRRFELISRDWPRKRR